MNKKRQLVKIIGLAGGLGAGVSPTMAAMPGHSTTSVVNITVSSLSSFDGLSADTLYQIGRKYQLGQGVSLDTGKAFRFYRMAAIRGLAKAQYALGLLYANDEVTSVTVAEPKAARQESETVPLESRSALGRKLARGEEHFEQAMQDDLRWLGLEWHEGPGQDGGHGPYWQSERTEIYRQYFQQLQQQGLAYPCFCSEHELKVARKAQLAAGKAPRYNGRCHGLSQEEVVKRFASGTPATLRFHVDDAAEIEFVDQVRGPQHYLGRDIGDFIIRRSDGTPAFFFSNAVDDALMEVSLVVRGEDHLTNTPRQILLLQALGLTIPKYAHIALVVDRDGAPLSKRQGSKTIEELRETGYLPAAINNYLARLGHTYEATGYLPLAQLAAEFDVDRLHKSPARFDETQLRHWQKETILKLSDEELWAWLTQHKFQGIPAIDGIGPDR